MLICRGDTVLRNPTNRQIADCLGFNEAIDETKMRDLIIVGAGPVRAGGRGVRRLGRAGRAGHRDECAGRAGGVELEDRELSRIPDRAFRGRTWPAAPTRRRRSSARRSSSPRERESWPASRRPYAVRAGRRPARAGAHGDHRHGRGLSAARPREPVAVRGRRRLLRRDVHRSAAVP